LFRYIVYSLLKHFVFYWKTCIILSIPVLSIRNFLIRIVTNDNGFAR